MEVWKNNFFKFVVKNWKSFNRFNIELELLKKILFEINWKLSFF